MATIKTLTNLATPTGAEDVVVQNETGNFKMRYRPIITSTGSFTASTINEAITNGLDTVRNTYGDLEDYHVQAEYAISGWPNGIMLAYDVVKFGTYVANWGIAYTQAQGVYAFQRFDTIGGAAGTLRVSELGTGLA